MGYLITVGGGEYTGKTSVVVPALKNVLELCGYNVEISREPGGTRKGEEIREKIFARLRENATAEELALLFNEARKIHLEEVVWPILGEKRDRDAILILDRYLDSTRVYQGYEGGVPMETLAALERTHARSFYPDLTLILYFAERHFVETMETRRLCETLNRGGDRSKTAWDESNITTHFQRQRYYLALPAQFEKEGIIRRFATVEASRHPFEVVKDAVSDVGELLGDQARISLSEGYEALLRRGDFDGLHKLWKDSNALYKEHIEGRRKYIP